MEPKVERIVLVVGLIVILIFSWLKPLDGVAEAQINSGFKRALASYAIARTLNAVISVAQGTQVAIEPGGIGVNLAPGQILDPVNDLVEQFSELMLAALIAFGVMKIALSIGSSWGLSLFLSGAAAYWVWMRWNSKPPSPMLTKVLFMLLFVRFAMPLVTVGSDFVFQRFLAEEYKESQNAISLSSNQLAKLSPPTESIELKADAQTDPVPIVKPPIVISEVASASPAESSANPKPGLFEGFATNFKEKAVHTLAVAKDATLGKIERMKDVTLGKIEKMKDLAAQIVEHLVKIIVVFLLQTLVIPLMLLWALLSLWRSAFNSVKTIEATSLKQ